MNYLVYSIKVEDKDDPRSNNGPPFTFEIISGDLEGRFQMTGSSGEIRSTRLFLGHLHQRYVLNIRVTDSGRPPLSASTKLTVHVRIIYPVQ